MVLSYQKENESLWILDITVAGEKVENMLTWRPSSVILQGNPAFKSCGLVWG